MDNLVRGELPGPWWRGCATVSGLVEFLRHEGHLQGQLPMMMGEDKVVFPLEK